MPRVEPEPGAGGREVVVVRANDEAVVQLLVERLAPRLVEHPETGAAISLRVGGPSAVGRSAHVVFRNGFTVVQTHDLETALQAVVQTVATFGPVPAGATPMHVRSLEHGGSVVLVADSYTPAVDGRHRTLTQAGYTRGFHSPVWVDARRGEALLPGVAPDDQWRRVPISRVVVFAPDDGETASPAVRIHHLLPLVAPRDRAMTADDVRALVDLTARVPVVRLDVQQPSLVARALVSLVTD